MIVHQIRMLLLAMVFLFSLPAFSDSKSDLLKIVAIQQAKIQELTTTLAQQKKELSRLSDLIKDVKEKTHKRFGSLKVKLSAPATYAIDGINYKDPKAGPIWSNADFYGISCLEGEVASGVDFWRDQNRFHRAYCRTLSISNDDSGW